jgi:hypothetical protein
MEKVKFKHAGLVDPGGESLGRPWSGPGVRLQLAASQ